MDALLARVEEEVANALCDPELAPYHVGMALGAILKSDDMPARRAALELVERHGFGRWLPKPSSATPRKKKRSRR